MPASGEELRNELTACLTLVAPAGMDQQARNEWLKAAGPTLAGIPTDLLRIGCTAARRTADHPSKIVPAIMREVEQLWAGRREALSREADRYQPRLARPDEPEYVTADQAAEIIDQFGLRPPEQQRRKAHVGPPRLPTEAELAEIAAEFGKAHSA